MLGDKPDISSRWQDFELELKSDDAIRPATLGGNLEAGGFKASSNVDLQLRKSAAIRDFARGVDVKITARGRALTGDIVEMQIDPSEWTRSSVVDYKRMHNN